MQSEISTKLRKTIANYQKLGVRRMAKAENHGKRSTNFYLDLTNVWNTKSNDQNKQYSAIRDSSLFSDERAITFLKFNYRSSEQGGLEFSTAFKKFDKHPSIKIRHRGTMQITDLWNDNTMQEVMGSPAFPRDRLKILKVWARKGVDSADHFRPNASLRLHTDPS